MTDHFAACFKNPSRLKNILAGDKYYAFIKK